MVKLHANCLLRRIQFQPAVFELQRAKMIGNVGHECNPTSLAKSHPIQPPPGYLPPELSGSMGPTGAARNPEPSTRANYGTGGLNCQALHVLSLVTWAGAKPRTVGPADRTKGAPVQLDTSRCFVRRAARGAASRQAAQRNTDSAGPTIIGLLLLLLQQQPQHHKGGLLGSVAAPSDRFPPAPIRSPAGRQLKGPIWRPYLGGERAPRGSAGEAACLSAAH